MLGPLVITFSNSIAECDNERNLEIGQYLMKL